MQSVDAAKALGEYLGPVVSVKGRTLEIRTEKPMANGDGLSFVSDGAAPAGARADVVQGNRVTLREPVAVKPGTRVYRNFDVAFERELERNMPRRVIDVKLDWQGDTRSEPGMTAVTVVTAMTEDGLRFEKRFVDEAPVAEKPETALENLRRQLGKHTGPFAFSVASVEAEPVRFYPASFLNGIRRELADELLRLAEARERHSVPHTPRPGAAAHNVSTLDIPGELLRSRYCIRRELGRCPVKPSMTTPRPLGAEPLWLVNQGNRLRLRFDCSRCEMIIEKP